MRFALAAVAALFAYAPAQSKTITIDRLFNRQAGCCALDASYTPPTPITFEAGDTIDITFRFLNRVTFDSPLYDGVVNGFQLSGGSPGNRFQVTNSGTAFYELINPMGDYLVSGPVAVPYGIGFAQLPIAKPGEARFGSFEGIRVVFQVTGNAPPSSGNSLSFIQLSFYTQNNVPEPATWAMMVIGFGAAGATVRRQAKAPAGARTARALPAMS